MFQAINVIGQIATTFLEGRVAKQKGENQIKVAEAEAKAKILSSESDWEKIMAQNQANSWKDEWLVVLFSVPLILCFCGDWGREIVSNGFEALEKMPTFYQAGLGAMIASSFAIRGVSKFYKK
tara:strand:+ start:6623 stop:6991 length:369 start_codon:yes stop_codon:yes gene_type:complete